MAKYKVAGNTVYKQDDKNGTIRDLVSYVDTITSLGQEFMPLDVTAFADGAERVIAGIEKSVEWTISGFFEDTATTGPDAVLAPLVGTLGTFEYYPAGTTAGRRKLSGECLCIFYRPKAEVKGRVEYEAGFKLDGTMTIGTA